ncbi:MAG: hypothetical protein KGO52_17125 [Nitrospirota bacterium]|nr:hypothetical protein [Nitrospirota bacterium]MDE3119747.1 hypothetical protein [Nitrospirota bacterium]MDE3225162.1 hypothetical protein [Nitrospirota bacterium]MDE3244425.1 hypothetical protein [Nitrospirota bacterium]
MTDQEINRAIQYVTASTSYGRDTVAGIIQTGLGELEALATSTHQTFERDALMEYVCRWTMRRTGHPEPLVREILGCAGRWLDQMCDLVLKDAPKEA